MAFGAKKTRAVSVLAGFILLPLVSVAHATQVTLTATDMGDGGVLLTASASTSTQCLHCNVYGDCSPTTQIDVGIPTIPPNCGKRGEGSASCSVILDRGSLHGERTFSAYAWDCNRNQFWTTTTTNFNNTPSASVTGPSGTVSAPFDITGTATFTPTLHPTKGNIHAYINGQHVASKYCTTVTCEYSYKELSNKLYDLNHGSHIIKLIAHAGHGNGVSATDTGTFNVDKTPTVTITAPPGGRVKTPFEIAGTATFKPTLSATKGSITVSINNGNIGTKQCTTETCQYSYQELYGKLYTGSVGTKVTLKLTATGSGASASDEREFYVEDLIEDLGEPTDDPVEPQPPSCAAREQP